ncbi:ABC transporter substrate-binding protein [Clostridiaceae bacterium HSG29]|nr:ABC transporter substrate-binding protein [Clostridiaceae bacterium HSG29]
MLKRSFLLVLVVILVFSFAGCNAKSEINEEEKIVEENLYLEYVDGMNREVIFENEPMTIVSVAPSVTETIFAIGAGDKLVGRTDYCDYPSQVSEIESVGSLREINIEKIAEINPDVVLASTHFKKEALDKLTELNIKVAVIISQENFEGVYKNIEDIGKIVNKNEEANNLVAEMKSKVNYVKDSIKDIDKKPVYYVVGFGEYGDFTATGDTFISELLEMAGGDNIAKDATGWKYSIEKLVEQDPEILICENDESTMSGIIEANGYKDLTAVKSGNLFGVDKNMISRMGPRLADALVQVAKVINPEEIK